MRRRSGGMSTSRRPRFCWPHASESSDAIVTGASEKGTGVRIREPSVEWKVVRGSQGLDVGDHVRVELVDTDVERG